MFNLVTSPEPGRCAARRCGQNPIGSHEGIELCERHAKMWQAAGFPPFNTASPEPATKRVKGSKTEVLSPDQKAQLDARRDEYLQVLGTLATWRIETQEHMEAAESILSTVHDQEKQLEAMRTSVTKPLLEAKRAVDALFKPALESAGKCKDVLKELIRQRMLAQRAEQDRALALVAGGQTDHATLVQAHGLGHVEQAGSGAAEVWRYEVEDAALVPASYWAINHSMIADQVKREKGACSIPGIKVFRDLSVRAK